MFDVKTLASMSGASVEEVRTFLPSVLSAIRDYTNRSFITNVGISGDFTVSGGNKILLPEDIPSEIVVDSQFELKYSLNNTKIYTVKSINGREIETYEKLFEETFNGFLIKLSFKNIADDVVSSMVNYKKSVSKLTAVKSESLDGYTYTLNVDSTNSTNGYPNNLMNSLSSLRQLPDKREVEYYERGFVKVPFCRYS